MLLRAEAVYPDQVVPGINGGKFRLRPLPEFRKIRLRVCRRHYLFRFITEIEAVLLVAHLALQGKRCLIEPRLQVFHQEREIT